ncbi:MAG: ABC transporter permease [Bdellovibrionales bacterium]|nr:ABC transporter permease [Bdellovibrionales bacterium]
MTIAPKYRPFLTLYYREIRRFLKVLVQTIAAPIVSSSLYLLIFGVSLGGRINLESGLSYLAFLIPGLVMMSVLNNAFQNASSSVVSGKFGGDLEDWRTSPLTPRAILWALSFGGLTRGFIVGFITFMVGQIFYLNNHGSWLAVAHPGYLLIFLIIGGLSFSMFGVSVAFWSKTFDHLSAVGSFVILPLIYLGGVFFSLEGLHPFWQTLSKANPLLYFINGVRYGILGVSDVPVETSLIVSGGALIIFYFIALRILNTAEYTRW